MPATHSSERPPNTEPALRAIAMPADAKSARGHIRRLAIAVSGFTRKYGVKMLVWFEQHQSRETAFQRERQLKNGIELGSFN